MVLDLGLPGLDGVTRVEALAAIRAARFPVLILTARGQWGEKVAGLRRRRRQLRHQAVSHGGGAGAPARAHPPLRRACRARAFPAARSCSTPTSGKVTVNGSPIKLTAQELRLLAYLMHHQGKVVSRTEEKPPSTSTTTILTSNSNTIEVFIGRLRKKLGRAEVIANPRGLGYQLSAAGRGQFGLIAKLRPASRAGPGHSIGPAYRLDRVLRGLVLGSTVIIIASLAGTAISAARALSTTGSSAHSTWTWVFGKC